MRQHLWVLIFLHISLTINAQQVNIRQAGSHTRLITTEVRPQTPYSFDEVGATAVAIKYNGDLDGAYLTVNNQEFPLTLNEHYQEESEVTNLLIFDEAINNFDLFTGGMSGGVEVIVIDAGNAHDNPVPRLHQQQDECSQPAMVDQSVWREGLPEPLYNRSFTVTENIIIHHSATSNELNDYTNIVRNIYLYHTQGNGWSDIGYNYLIAPDGTIFKGRDPGDGKQDQVIGAHFCGKNSTTMGVCLMGTYSNIPPSDETLTALSQLLAWKTGKDKLDPFGIDPHPLNASLPVIAGHRDGCSTECPGQETYERLSEIRYETAETSEQCGEEEPLAFALYPNPAASYFKVELVDGSVHRFVLYDIRGQFFSIRPALVQNKIATFSTGDLIPGLYILHYQAEDELIKKRLVIAN